MSNKTPSYSARDLLTHWHHQDLITDQDTGQLTNFMISRQQQKELPLYLRALVGVGAFFSSFFFILFLFTIDLINWENVFNALIWGGGFIGAAIGLLRFAMQGNHMRHSFYLQSSFAFMAVGKTLCVMGVSQWLESDWGVTIALLLVTSLTYFIYRMSIDRYLSTLAMCLSVLINIFSVADVAAYQNMLFHLFFFGQLSIVAFLIAYPRVTYAYKPLTYALLTSLSICILYLAGQIEIIAHLDQPYWILTGYINIALILTLWILIIWAAGGLQKWRKHPLCAAYIAILLLGLISAPGILWGLGLMILGYGRHERLLIIAGALLFPLFIWLYYYNLDITLLQKSLILFGSGVILLAGHFYMRVQGWARAEKNHETLTEIDQEPNI